MVWCCACGSPNVCDCAFESTFLSLLLAALNPSCGCLSFGSYYGSVRELFGMTVVWSVYGLAPHVVAVYVDITAVAIVCCAVLWASYDTAFVPGPCDDFLWGIQYSLKYSLNFKNRGVFIRENN